MNPFEEIRGFENDVLIVHGTADKIVDIRYAVQAYETYKSEPYERKAEYCTIDGGAHMFSRPHDKIAIKHPEQFISK